MSPSLHSTSWTHQWINPTQTNPVSSVCSSISKTQSREFGGATSQNPSTNPVSVLQTFLPLNWSLNLTGPILWLVRPGQRDLDISPQPPSSYLAGQPLFHRLSPHFSQFSILVLLWPQPALHIRHSLQLSPTRKMTHRVFPSVYQCRDCVPNITRETLHTSTTLKCRIA